jgi:glycerophosphoryl diester phosphodiesterase
MIALLLLVAMPPELKTTAIIAQSWEKTLVVGHRGGAAYAPENTLPAFEKGIESQANAVECDVWMSRDHVPMVMHDATLDRTTDLAGAIADHDADEMVKGGVPTLEQLIKTTKGRINLIVEVKGGAGVEQAVTDLLKKYEVVDETIVFSFTTTIIAKMKELNKAQYAVWLSAKRFTPETLGDLDAQLKSISADAVGFPFGFVDAPLAEHLRAGKTPLFVWTVPPGGEVDRLKGLKVNFIITNSPKDVREQLGS